MDILFVIVLILLAMFLVIVEALLLPGITVAAIGAVASVIYAVYIVFRDYGFMWAMITFVVAAILSLLALFYAMRRKNLSKISLNTNSDSSVPKVSDSVKIGEHGLAVTRLSPMGSVLINGKSYEAKSISGMLNPKSEVVVVGFDDNVVTVKSI